MSPFRASTFFLLPTLTLSSVLLTGSAEPLRAAATRATPPIEPGARLVGVMVNPEIAPQDEDGGFPNLAFQGTMGMTKLAIVVDDVDGGLIALDRDGCEVATFTDDRGRTLFDEDSPFPPFGFGERVLKNGHRLALELEGAYAPTRGAKTITATGTLAVRSAHERATSTRALVDCKKGAKLASGSYEFRVQSNGEAQWGDGYELELETTDDLGAVISYAAVTEKGTRIELDVRSTMTFAGKSQIGLFSDVPVGAAKLEVVAWKDARVRRVPFSVRAMIGME